MLCEKILLYYQTWTSITQTEINDNIPTLHNVVHTENSHGAYNVCDTHFDQIFILFINVLLKLSFCLPFIYQKPQIRGQLRYLQSNNIDLWRIRWSKWGFLGKSGLASNAQLYFSARCVVQTSKIWKVTNVATSNCDGGSLNWKDGNFFGLSFDINPINFSEFSSWTCFSSEGW